MEKLIVISEQKLKEVFRFKQNHDESFFITSVKEEAVIIVDPIDLMKILNPTK